MWKILDEVGNVFTECDFTYSDSQEPFVKSRVLINILMIKTLQYILQLHVRSLYTEVP